MGARRHKGRASDADARGDAARVGGSERPAAPPGRCRGQTRRTLTKGIDVANEYLKATDDGLLTFAQNMAGVIRPIPASYGLSEGTVENYDILLNLYVEKLSAARTEATRGPVATHAKNVRKDLLLIETRRLAMAIQNRPETTDDQRTLLGLTIRSRHPTPRPTPTVAPGVELLLAGELGVFVTLAESPTSPKRRRPADTRGAAVYTAVGPLRPTSAGQWTLYSNQTKSTFLVEFPTDTPAGSLVWICARWLGETLEPGPASVPASIRIAGNVAAAA